MRIKVKLGQSILGFTFAFIMLAAMAIGLTRIWAWYNINFGSRQVRYQESRIAATTPGGSGNDYITQQIDKNLYRPLNLTEQWVFKGEPTESTPYTMPDFGSLQDAAADCRADCPECVTCVPDPDNPPQQICAVDINCPCYVRCMCNARIGPQISMYDQQIQALSDAANSMRNEADDLRREAERCDDPWELCWWGGFGVPSKKLRQAALALDLQAARLCCGPTSQAGMIATLRASVQQCCTLETYVGQNLCLECITASQCHVIRDGYDAEWDDVIDDLNCEIDFAGNIRNSIDNNYGRPAPDDNGCMKWADYQCKYLVCEPAAVTDCETEIQNNCLTDCQTHCTDDCTCIPPACDPAVFDPVCYAACVGVDCVEDPDITTWYEQCVFDRMQACIEENIAECNASCPGSPVWGQYYEECCQSFCCLEDPPPGPCSSSCSFGVFDRRFHGYVTWCNWLSPECCTVGPPDNRADGTWVYPGRIGDGCIKTWRARYWPLWTPCAWGWPDPWMCLDPQSWCGESFNNRDRWWGRNCVAPDTACDEDCEDPMDVPGWTMPQGCLVPPTEYNPSGIAMCGLEEFRNRQAGFIAEYEAEIAKYQRKQRYIAGCCHNLQEPPAGCLALPAGCLALPAGCIDWAINPDNSPMGPCSVRNETGEWEPQPAELTEFGCMATCMQMAAQLGEEVGEGESLEDLCPDCFNPPLPPDELETCVRECTGTTSDCCVQWCLANEDDPELYLTCINTCKGDPAAYGCPPIL